MDEKGIPTFNQDPKNVSATTEDNPTVGLKDNPTKELDPNQVSNHFCLELDHLKSEATYDIHRSTDVYDSNSVEIISCGSKFGPYKSQLEQEISEELFKYERLPREDLSNSGIGMMLSVLAVQIKMMMIPMTMKDTTNSRPCLMKEKNLPKLTMKLMDESGFDDDFNQDKNGLNEDMDDSSSKGLLKILRVTVHKRNRFVLVARSI